ncbi:hypothetical protein OF83DRAFT_1172190 [Amylostereum chailletii]|nr:hypothetical protein OF83DRAFT_1172190 [Amylostereum chailletii]
MPVPTPVTSSLGLYPQPFNPADPLFLSKYRDDRWGFTDGNIVLVGHDERAYCVHRGVLCLKSGFFRRMFKPLPFNLDIHMIDIRDMGNMANAFVECLYKPLQYSTFGRLRPSLQHIQSLLAVAHTYDMPELSEELEAHLRILFPSTLSEYHSNLRQRVLPEDFNPLLAIDISTTYNIPSILPLAVYLSVVLTGSDSPHPEMTGSFEALMQRDNGRDEIEGLLKKMANEGELELVWPRCDVECHGASDAGRDRLEHRYRRLAFDVFSSDAHEIVGDASKLEDEFCTTCTENLPGMGVHMREALWNNLFKAVDVQ